MELGTKFNRNYILTVQGNSGGDIIIKPPLTLDFTIVRNVMQSSNTVSIRVYNLNSTTRSDIRKDQFDFGNLKKVSLLAGYEDNLAILTSANISQAWSVREGVDYITNIEAYDAGFAYANASISSTYPSGTDVKNIATDLMNSLSKYDVSVGKIGEVKGTLTRGAVFDGNTIEILGSLVNGGFFIDNGKAYILGENEAFDTGVTVLNAQTGLLNVPIRDFDRVRVEMVFEPYLQVGQLVKLESSSDSSFNEIYKVVGIEHRGTISGATSGIAKTSVTLFRGFEAIREVR